MAEPNDADFMRRLMQITETNTPAEAVEIVERWHAAHVDAPAHKARIERERDQMYERFVAKHRAALKANEVPS